MLHRAWDGVKAFCPHHRPWFRCDECAGTVTIAPALLPGTSILTPTTATSRHLAALRAQERELYAETVLFGTRFPWLGCRIVEP